MKKSLQINIFVPVVIFIVGIIIGSINNLDLTINSNLYSPGNWFGLGLAAFGMIPGYGCLAFLAGAFIVFGMKRENIKVWLRVICYVMAAALFIVATYYSGKEIISVNAFNCPEKWYIGYPIGLVCMAGFGVWGFFTLKNHFNPDIWIVMVIMAAVALIVLVPGVTLIKSLLHRPRFRYVVNSELVEFHNWWEPCTNYKDYIGNVVAGHIITSEEFKSCPSGHTACAALTMMFLSYYPLFNEKAMKHQVWMYYVGVVWTLLVAFSRMLIGAHYLTDVCLGGLLFSIFFYIGNLVLINTYLKKKEKESTPETKVE